MNAKRQPAKWTSAGALDIGALPEALTVFELETVHHGLKLADEMLKAAPVRTVAVTPIPPGRFLVAMGGAVGDVEAANRRGLELSPQRIDHVYLAEVHPDVLFSIPGRPFREIDRFDASIGLFETETVAAALHAADRARKGAEVELLRSHLARGTHGKSFVLLRGRQDMVEAALDLARHCAEEHARWIGSTLLARPDAGLVQELAERPWGFFGPTEVL